MKSKKKKKKTTRQNNCKVNCGALSGLLMRGGSFEKGCALTITNIKLCILLSYYGVKYGKRFP